MKISKQRGVSLIELMISITIGLILMAGVLSIFLSSKVTYFTNEKTARLQENGRVALDLVTHDVRGAGYMGCARTVPFTNTLNGSTALLWNYALPLQGYESDNTSAWVPGITAGTLNPAPIPASDVIVTRVPVRDGRAMRVETNFAALNSEPEVLDSTPIKAGMIMMITDCVASSVFQVTNAAGGFIAHAASATGSPGNSTDDLGYLYEEGSRVVQLQTMAYYLGTNPLTSEPSLYRQTGATQPADLLIEGVEAMQVAYAVDTTGDRIADVYRAASTVGNWDNVMSVQLAMLIRSAEEGTAVDKKKYQLLPAAVGGREFGPYNDRRMRMVFTTTIALRNRAL